MNVGVVRAESFTYRFRRQDLASGYENICYALDSPWFHVEHAREMELDVALITGTAATIQEIIPRPPKWRKMVLLQESGDCTVNTTWYAGLVAAAKFDAIFSNSPALRSIYQLFGCPTVDFTLPFDFEKWEHLVDVEKDPSCVCLNLLRFKGPGASPIATLRAFQKLQELRPGTTGVAYISLPHVSEVNDLLENLGISGITVRPETHWHEYIAAVAGCGLFLSMDGRATYGRFALDAAACGIPCVGAYSAVQEKLYSRLMVKRNDCDQAAALAANVIGRSWPPENKAKSSFCFDRFVSDDFARLLKVLG